MRDNQFDNAVTELGNAAVNEVKQQADTQIQSAATALQEKVIDKIDNKVLRNASTKTLGKFASVNGIINAKSIDDVVDEFGNKLADEVKDEVKQQVDKAIKSVATTVQEKFLDKIGDEFLRDASTKTLGKLASFDGILGAFNSIQGNAGLLKETLGEAGRDIEKFLGGEMDRAALMVSLADKAETYIEDTFTKMATVYAAEFEPLAPEIGKIGGYIAASIFRDVVSPFINAALEAKRARKEYEELHEIIEASIEQMRLQREQFEKATSELFARRQNLIDNSLNELDAAISVKDVNKSATALGTITEEFGGKQKFKTLEEFVDFMTNNDEEWGI